MNKDLSVGSPAKNLWLYTLPLLGSVIFQQLYNLADSVVAGKFIGENALASVGNASEITFIYTSFAFGCNIGCSVVISQLFGSKKYKDVKTSVSTSFISFGIMCIVLMALGFTLTDTVLQLMNTPKNILPDSLLYLKIYTSGMLFVFFYNVSTGVFSAMGDSKTPLYLLAFSSLMNIGVDILFVTAFKMGVAGVAWATFICQGISCILSVILLLVRLKSLKTDEKFNIFSYTYFKKTLRIAIPSIIQQWCVSFGNIIVQGIVNIYGTSIIAGFTAATKLNNISTSVFVASANGVSTYTAQNIGAGKADRIKPGYKSCLSMGFICSAVLIFCYIVLGKYLILLFMQNGSTEALNAGMMFLRIVSPFYIAVSVKIITDGVLRGSGAVKLFMITTMIDLGLRVIFAFIFSKLWGSVGIWCAWPAGWIISAAISVCFYRSGRWKTAKI